MELVYALVGAGVVLVAVLLFVLRRKPHKVVSQKLSFDLLSGSQKNKKRKHFGFSKNKKKGEGEGESVKAERLPKDAHEKKGKKKGKNKGKGINVGGKNVLEVESQPEAESDNESVEVEEDRDSDENPGMEQVDDFSQLDAGKSAGRQKSRSPKADTESKESVIAGNAPGKGNVVDAQETAGDKKGKKGKPRKEDDVVVAKKEFASLSATKEKETALEKVSGVEKEDENGTSNNDEKDAAVGDASGEKTARKRKKKKKNGKPATTANGEHSGASVDVAEDVGSYAVAATSTVDQVAPAEPEDDDSEDGFTPVIRETTHVKATESNKPVKVETERPLETSNPMIDSLNALKISLESEKEKSKEMFAELNKERERNGLFTQAIEQLNSQMQDKDVKRVQLERTFEQQKTELKSIRDQLKDGCVAIQQLKDENKALKENITSTKHLVADDSVKMELQTRVRVMDDALKQNAIQMNASENARKDLEMREKRHLERIMVLERDQQVVKNELSENLQKSEQRSQNMSAELQRLTLELNQVEKMRTHFMDLEKQKADLERLLQAKESQNKDLVTYGIQKDADFQRMQAEISRMNETFQRRSCEMEARLTDRDALGAQLDVLRQQLCQKDVELQRLQQKEAEFGQKEAELQLLNQKGAEFVQREAELQRLQQKEAEFAQKEVELQRLQHKVTEFAQKEVEFIQKEAELQRVQLAVTEFAQKEAEFFQREAELQRAQQAVTEFGQREAELIQKEAELQRVQSVVTQFDQKEAEFTQKEVELQRAQQALAEFAQKEAGFTQKEAELQSLQETVADFVRKEADSSQREAELERLRQKEVDIAQQDIELTHMAVRIMELEAKVAKGEAELIQKEAELQRLQSVVTEFDQKEAEFTQKEVELQRVQQTLSEFAQKEAGFTQKEVELQSLQETVADFVRREAESSQREEAELERLRQKEVDIAQQDKELTHMAVRIMELEAKVAQGDQNEINVARLHEVEGQVVSCHLEMNQLHQKEADLIQEVGRLKEQLSAIQGETRNFEEAKLTMAGEVHQLSCDNKLKDEQLTQLEQEKHVLQDTIEQMKTELLQRLSASDAQLRQALDEKDKEIERLKSQRIAAEGQSTDNIEVHSKDLQASGDQHQADGLEQQIEAQSFVDVDNAVIHDKH